MKPSLHASDSPGRFSRDERGTSMVTTAITLPLLIIVVMGIYWAMWFFTIKQTLHHGLLDAANFISDQARFWNIDPTGASNVADASGDDSIILPANYYDMEAKRVVANRLRDFMLPAPMITTNLFVTVTEPILAYNPENPQAPIEVGLSDKGLCWKDASEVQDYVGEGLFRAPENVRFLVLAKYDVPLWDVNLPWTESRFAITLHDRATGYVQCPRWSGQLEAADPNKSQWLAQEGPFMPYRLPISVSFPTVTPPGGAGETATPEPATPTPP